MTQNTKTWLHGLVAAGITSFSTAASGLVVLPDVFNFSRPGLLNIVKLVTVPTAIAVFGYLKQSPLPALILSPGDKATLTDPVLAPDGSISGSSATLEKAPPAV